MQHIQRFHCQEEVQQVSHSARKKKIDLSDEVLNLVATMLHKSWKAFEMKWLCFAEELLIK
jgi:hypothetical protein